MSTVSTAVSRSDQAKEVVLEAIRKFGGKVEGADLFEIKILLGLEQYSNNVLSSALWKLVVQDGKLIFHSRRDWWDGPGLRGDPPITSRTYQIRR